MRLAINYEAIVILFRSLHLDQQGGSQVIKKNDPYLKYSSTQPIRRPKRIRRPMRFMIPIGGLMRAEIILQIDVSSVIN